MELRPTTPHFEESVSTTRRRPLRIMARFVSASSRFGVLKPARSSMPCTPRKTAST